MHTHEECSKRLLLDAVNRICTGYFDTFQHSPHSASNQVLTITTMTAAAATTTSSGYEVLGCCRTYRVSSWWSVHHSSLHDVQRHSDQRCYATLDTHITSHSIHIQKTKPTSSVIWLHWILSPYKTICSLNSKPGTLNSENNQTPFIVAWPLSINNTRITHHRPCVECGYWNAFVQCFKCEWTELENF